MKANIIPMIDPQQQARTRFSQYVQSVAFNLTLSRKMIDMLQVVRDYGFPHIRRDDGRESAKDWEKWKEAHQASRFPNAHNTNGTQDGFVVFMNSLERRGLVYCNPTPYNERKYGERGFRLSDAGELVCLLLVECGLMVPAVTAKKARR